MQGSILLFNSSVSETIATTMNVHLFLLIAIALIAAATSQREGEQGIWFPVAPIRWPTQKPVPGMTGKTGRR